MSNTCVAILWVSLVMAATFNLGCRSGPKVAGEARAGSGLAVETEAWHSRRLESLMKPDGWLTLVALEWLESGPNHVGREPDAQVSYAGFPADRIGTMFVEGDQVRFEAAPGVTVTGVPPDGVLHTDADESPTVLAVGEIRFHVIVRGGRLAVRVKDADAPTRTRFGGIERYPVRESWVVVAEFVPAGNGETVAMETVVGTREDVPIAGRARFVHEGVQIDTVLMDEGGGSLLLRFADTTNGSGTFSGGRYLHVDASADGRTVVLDFNRAYNPPCAFTEFATCTIPVPSNRFPFAVTAGEQWGGG